MGRYLNPGNAEFASILRDHTYVDKTELIGFINNTFGTTSNRICSTRPRRFGKTFAAQMLAAYYSRGADSKSLFDLLAIANPPHTDPNNLRAQKIASYKKHLNQYDVIFWDISQFISYCVNNIDNVINKIEKSTIRELNIEFPDIPLDDSMAFGERLAYISLQTGRKFFFIIDEWDALFREAPQNEALQKKYILFLRGLFKGNVQQYLQGCYITGILPIKKYGTQSALTDFNEFTMVAPQQLGEFVGFTEKEVKQLCEEHAMDFTEMRRWYDGYHFEETGHIYSPRSVIAAIDNHCCDSYWTATETYESLKTYIELNFDGLQDAITSMLGSVRQPVDVLSFTNDFSSFNNKDDVLTVLVHLGYLGYDRRRAEVYIPNEEIRQEFIRTIKNSNRKSLAKAIELSDKLLKSILRGDEEETACLIEEAHNANTSPTFYNNEQALRSVVVMALFASVDHYHRFEEISAGRGYTDLCFIPKPHSGKPPLLIELKWDKPSTTALNQIKDKQYTDVFKKFGLSGEALAIGISYNTSTGKHNCRIEKVHIS